MEEDLEFSPFTKSVTLVLYCIYPSLRETGDTEPESYEIQKGEDLGIQLVAFGACRAGVGRGYKFLSIRLRSSGPTPPIPHAGPRVAEKGQP